MSRLFLNNFVCVLSMVSLLMVSHVEGQNQKSKSKLSNLTLDKIYEGKKKVIFKDKLFDELNDIRVNQGVLELKKKLLEYKNKTAYGILRFESDKTSLKKDKSVSDKYDQSVWILVYSYKLNPENMLAFIDLAEDGFTYDETDLSIDEVAYITPTSFKVLPTISRRSEMLVSFFVPYTDKDGVVKGRQVKVSHGAVESKYYFFYKQAVNCIKNPYAFRPFRGSLITFSSECILPKKQISQSKEIVKEVENLEVEIPTSDDPNLKTVLMSNPEAAIYKRLSCVGVGRLGNKCVIYNTEGWKLLK